MNNKITLILLLKDRINYTFRWMDFANNHLNKFKILIADGGKDLEIENHLRNTQNYPKLKYQYLRFPFDENYSDYFKKVFLSLEMATTEYSILLDNDDFVFPISIIKSIEFLDKNKNYSTCRGQIIPFKVNLEVFYKEHKQTSLYEDDLLGRLGKDIKTILPTFYDVHRTKNHLNSYKKFYELDVNELLLIEVYPFFIDIIDGNIGRLDMPFLYREQNSINSFHKEFIYKYGSLFERLIFGTLSSDYKKTIRSISDVLSSRINFSKKDSLDFIKKIFIDFIFNNQKRKKNFFYEEISDKIFKLKSKFKTEEERIIIEYIRKYK